MFIIRGEGYPNVYQAGEHLKMSSLEKLGSDKNSSAPNPSLPSHVAVKDVSQVNKLWQLPDALLNTTPVCG